MYPTVLNDEPFPSLECSHQAVLLTALAKTRAEMSLKPPETSCDNGIEYTERSGSLRDNSSTMTGISRLP